MSHQYDITSKSFINFTTDNKVLDDCDESIRKEITRIIEWLKSFEKRYVVIMFDFFGDFTVSWWD